MSDIKFKIKFGSVETKLLHKFENGRMVTYGYSIEYDLNGIETGRTDPEPLGSIGWDSGKPFTEADYRSLTQ
jgi:hypothetical protein